jgi:hypothetical protein
MTFLKNMLIVTVTALIAISTSSCSVIMAASGTPTPNTEFIDKGASKQRIEMQLGQPKSVQMNAQGKTTFLYEYQVGNESSAGRAIVHSAMDLMTLGLWEVIGTPIEIANGDKFQIAITYNADETVETIRRSDKNKKLALI